MSAAPRPATAEDVPRLLAIEAACFGPPRDPAGMSHELSRAWARVRVAEAQGEGVVAYVTAWRVADELEILQVATLPEARRAGHARALLLALFAEARGEGVTRALLEVRPSNAGAVALYRALGFAEVSRRAGYYDDGEDALVLALTLTERV